jgi:hypothetical protein
MLRRWVTHLAGGVELRHHEPHGAVALHGRRASAI